MRGTPPQGHEHRDEGRGPDGARERDGDGERDGDRERGCPDAIFLDNGQVKLRSERLAQGNGRVYVIAFTARDASGGESSGSVEVCVPSRRRHGTCVNDGQTVNSLGSCSGRRASRHEAGTDAIALTPRSSDESAVTLEFTLPRDCDVVVAVFDVAGRRLGTLENGPAPAGLHTVTWSTSGVPRGMYFVRLRVGSQAVTKAVRVLQ